jgi:molybdopterin converting factor small subunit
MDSVRVRLFAAARAAVGAELVETRPGTLADICDQLEQEHAAFADVRPRCSFLVDEVAVHGDPSEVRIPAGSQVDVLPPFAGG